MSLGPSAEDGSDTVTNGDWATLELKHYELLSVVIGTSMASRATTTPSFTM